MKMKTYALDWIVSAKPAQKAKLGDFNQQGQLCIEVVEPYVLGERTILGHSRWLSFNGANHIATQVEVSYQPAGRTNLHYFYTDQRALRADIEKGYFVKHFKIIDKHETKANN